MIQKELKKIIASLPEKNDNLEVGFYIVTDDISDVGEIPILDELTFQDWKHDDMNIKETVDFLFNLN